MNERQKPWVKFYKLEKIPESMNYPDGSVYDIVKTAAMRYPNKIAYEFEEKKTNYKEFIKKVDHLAACLYKLGVKKGENIFICMPNTPQAVLMFYAVVKCGAVSTMIHPLLSKVEIKTLLNDSQSRIAVTFDRISNKFIDIKEETCLEKLIVADIADELPFVRGLGYKIFAKKKTKKVPDLDYVVRWNDLLNFCRSDDMPHIEVKAEDVSIMLYSGGTTGIPKGVELTNRNMNAAAYCMLAMSKIMPCTIDELYSEEGRKKGLFRDYSVLSIMPIFHGFGLCVGMHMFLSFGGKCILVPIFTPESFAKLIMKKRPNLLFGVPTLFERMVRHNAMANVDLSCIDGIFVGGDTLLPKTKQKVNKFLSEHNCKVVVREGYGLTETMAAACLTPFNHGREGSIGIPLPDTLFSICEVGTSKQLPYGKDGEICISGPTVMKGYYNNEKETKQTLMVHNDGRTWLHTGDIGMMDEDGYVYFKQRCKRIIVSSGYNIYPSQIEMCINKFPGVVECCAIGIPDPIKVQRIKVFVVPEKGIVGDEKMIKNLIEYSKQHFAKFAVPKDFEFIDKLPRTNVAKVAYKELEELNQEEPEK